MHPPANATCLPFPVHLTPWAVARFRASRERMRAALGKPHFVEDDPTRTAGGDEDNWAWQLADGQRVLIVLAVPYHDATLYCDPPVAGRAVSALGLSTGDSLDIFPRPIRDGGEVAGA